MMQQAILEIRVFFLLSLIPRLSHPGELGWYGGPEGQNTTNNSSF